ncbi:MAG: hypothetical protein M1821_003752 [Bathelium mastoideum]|nr:MAG: hypothetical protein M1821_003752 [Bathelium mastoideum]KAI9690835.1 MAG: hypothetical protein M1822_008454 [Bathelium mastoideum]
MKNVCQLRGWCRRQKQRLKGIVSSAWITKYSKKIVYPDAIETRHHAKQEEASSITEEVEPDARSLHVEEQLDKAPAGSPSGPQEDGIIGPTSNTENGNKVVSQLPDELPEKASYSEGGPRVVTMDDGKTTCFALLLSAGLVNNLRLNICLTKKIEVLREHIRTLDSQVIVLKTQRSRIDEEISRLKRKQSDQSQGSSNEGESVEKQIQALKSRKSDSDDVLRDLEKRLYTYEVEEGSLSTANDAHHMSLHDLLGKPLRESGLLVEDKVPSTPECIPMEDSVSIDLGQARHPTSTWQEANSYLESEYPSASRLLHANVTKDVHAKAYDLMRIREQFEDLDNLYRRDKAEFCRQQSRGEHRSDITNLDISHVLKKQKATHDLINAEAEYDEARRRARGMGVCEFHDDESCFLDRSNDGYSPSMEGRMKAGIDRGYLKTWITQCKEQKDDSADAIPEIDEWASSSVDVSDSISMKAEGRLRTKIHAWRERTER